MAIGKKGKGKGKSEKKDGPKKRPIGSIILYPKNEDGSIDYDSPEVLGACWLHVNPWGKEEISGDIESGRLKIIKDGGYLTRDPSEGAADEGEELPDAGE